MSFPIKAKQRNSSHFKHFLGLAESVVRISFFSQSSCHKIVKTTNVALHVLLAVPKMRSAGCKKKILIKINIKRK